jgi:hypothetical protein
LPLFLDFCYFSSFDYLLWYQRNCLVNREIGGDLNMTYCETCGVNVKKKRLRECVFSGHVIRWNYWKKDVPIVKTTRKEEEKLKQIKAIAEKIKQILPPDKLADIQSKSEEIRREFEVILNEELAKRYNIKSV